MKLKLVRATDEGGAVASAVVADAHRHSGVRPSPLSTNKVGSPFAVTTLGYALSHLVEVTGALASTVFVLEDGELLPLNRDGSETRLSPSARRRLGHALFARRHEQSGGVGFFPEPFQHALLLPFFDGDAPLGVVCLGGHEPFDELTDFRGSIELVGLALASDLKHLRRTNDTADLVEMSRLASLGMLLVGVAHELRGPAGALALLVPDVRALLANPRLDWTEGSTFAPAELAADQVGRDLARCSDRILELCEQLRGAARRDLVIEPTNLSDVARDAIEIVRLNAPTIVFTLGEIGQGFNVMVRRGEIAQVLQNLLLNAIDACRSSGGAGRIEVLVATGPDGATVEVADDGTGVAPAIAASIFQPFFTTKARGKGTGVGLYVSREIAIAHGGELTVANNASGGATFSLRLPNVVSDARPKTGLRASVSPLLTSDRSRVLFVDDDELVLRTYKRALGRYDVVSVSSIADAKRELATGSIDVVLADLGMPGGGGAALHAWMLETLGDGAPPFVFLTGGFTSDDDQTYVERSGCTCLLKPTPIKDLAAAIETQMHDRERR